MNVDPNGNFSIRLIYVQNSIDLAIATLPAFKTLRILIKNKATKKLNKNLKTPHIRKEYERNMDGVLSQAKIDKKYRKQLIVALFNSILLVFDSSIGKIIVNSIKYFFPKRVYKKKAKKYFYYGPTKVYDYFKVR